MANQHFYEQATNVFNREWVDDNSDGSDMTDEEEMDFRAEMEAVNADAAAYGKQEREDFGSSRFTGMDTFAMDVPF